MGLLNKDTRWIFLLPNPASHKTDERHIQDIAFGIKCLLTVGIDYSDIDVFIDNVSDTLVDYIFDYLEVQKPSEIFSTKELENIVSDNKKKNAVVFITGHGSSEGMVADTPIKPYELYRIFQVAPCLEKTVFYFGQCYAGIFNYMPLSKHLNLEGQFKNNITAIGATGFTTSISMRQNLPNGKIYFANIFLLYVYKWIVTKKDIDGDGLLSVMDSFKYATIEINREIHDSEKNHLLQSVVSIEKLLKVLQEKDTSKLTKEEQLQLDIEERTLQDNLDFYNITQETWILNASVAMNTVF